MRTNREVVRAFHHMVECPNRIPEPIFGAAREMSSPLSLSFSGRARAIWPSMVVGGRAIELTAAPTPAVASFFERLYGVWVEANDTEFSEFTVWRGKLGIKSAVPVVFPTETEAVLEREKTRSKAWVSKRKLRVVTPVFNYKVTALGKPGYHLTDIGWSW